MKSRCRAPWPPQNLVVFLNRHPDACALVAKTERGKTVIYFASPRPPNGKGAEAGKDMNQPYGACRRQPAPRGGFDHLVMTADQTAGSAIHAFTRYD